MPREPTLDIPVRQGTPINWEDVLNQYPGKYVAGSSMLFLTQPDGTEVVGTVAINPMDSTILTVSWDRDTINTNTGIDSQGKLDTDIDYHAENSHRPNSPGTFDAIIDPTKVYPGNGITNLKEGDRFLIIEDIIDTSGNTIPNPWGNFTANANDIIEYTGTQWQVIFDSGQETDTLIYQTNIYTGVQYIWNGVYWNKSFEGEYPAGSWRLEL